MRLIDHIHYDWTVRVPCLLRYNRYRGLSRPAYALLCILFHVVKSAILLCLKLIKILLWDMWAEIIRRHGERYDDSEYDEEDEADDSPDADEEDYEDEEDELRFCQLFVVSPDMSLLVDHVEMCPDETAFIRVVDEEGYTPLYKRKIRRDKLGNRYLVFSGRNYYLDNTKTQPTVCMKK